MCIRKTELFLVGNNKSSLKLPLGFSYSFQLTMKLCSPKASLFVLFAAISASAAPNMELKLTTAGLGPITFGSSLEQVERTLGSKLKVAPAQRSKWRLGECSVSAAGLAGVKFVFAQGALSAVEIANGSTISTRSGLVIGDLERKAIDLLKSDPTFSRSENRYGDGKGTAMEILLGKTTFDQKTGSYKGNAMRVSSRAGTIVVIVAGLASYVMVDEHDGASCE